MTIIKVNDHIYIHCQDNALYKYIKANYVDDVTDPEKEQLLDDLTEIAGDGEVHAYLTYEDNVEDWSMDHYEVK